jgi:hypothetical protein
VSGLSFHLRDWRARVPASISGDWALEDTDCWMDTAAPLRQLSMMTARRLGSGDRQVVDCVLDLLAGEAADALVLCSQHGELERNDRVMHALATQASVSPTDFTMSVHNAAAGTCTIVAGQPLITSSLSAGGDTFQQALYEVASLMQVGYRRVLLADFEGHIPAFYRERVGVQQPLGAYAVCLLLEAGQQWDCQPFSLAEGAPLSAVFPDWPQSLQCLHGMLSGVPSFQVRGPTCAWQWSLCCD